MTGIADFVQQGPNFLAAHRKASPMPRRHCRRAGPMTRVRQSPWQIAADRVIDCTLPGERN
ncbi:hypothetical protein ACVIJ6_006180 [Bradyrhizobium sp. USDA 4369]